MAEECIGVPVRTPSIAGGGSIVLTVHLPLSPAAADALVVKVEELGGAQQQGQARLQ